MELHLPSHSPPYLVDNQVSNLMGENKMRVKVKLTGREAKC